MMIIIHKSKKSLEVWEGGNLLGTFPIGIGKVEIGHKETEGDMRTPEGDYVVCVKNPKSKYHLSLGLNFPNNKDAEQGLKKNLITREEHDAIVDANNRLEIPLWKTKLGGEIYIHGHLEKQSWSQGCIRMNDADIESFYDGVSIGTRVYIHP